MASMSKHAYTKIQPYAIVIVASLFYFFEYGLRVAPQIMTTELMREFHIGASGLGILASLFYWGYAPMQIPVGMLLDRFNARHLMALSVFVCACAAVAFASTHNVYVAGVARFLIGFTASFACVGALVLAARWLTSRCFAMTAGFVQVLGCIGAIVGERPIALLVQRFGWQEGLHIINVLGFVLAILFWLVIRNAPPNFHIEYEPHHKMRNALKEVLKKPQNWCAALLAFSLWGPVSIYAEFWGVAHLQAAYAINAVTAATWTSVIWVGIMIGGPFHGWWSAHINSRRTPLLFGSAMAVVSSILLLYFHLPYALLFVVLFVYGASASAMTVTFGLIHDLNPPRCQGSGVGFNNMATLLGGLLLLPLVGFIMDSLLTGNIVSGVKSYDLTHFRIGLSVIPICNALGLLTSFALIKETHGKAE